MVSKKNLIRSQFEINKAIKMNSTTKSIRDKKIKFIIKKLSLIDSFKSTNLPLEILEIIIGYKKRMEETVDVKCCYCRGSFKYNKELYLKNEISIGFSGLCCNNCM